MKSCLIFTRSRFHQASAPWRTRPIGPLVALGSVIAIARIMVASSAVFAATGHGFLSAISQAPPGSSLSAPGAIAVERASGRVFVGDRGAGAVDVFGPSGTFESRFGESMEVNGLAVDETSGDVFVAEPFEDVVRVFAPDGKGGYEQASEWSGAHTPNGAFGEVSGVAIDNSTRAGDPRAGDVYVSDAAQNAVDVLRPAGPQEVQEGSYVSSLSSGKLAEPNGVTVDSANGQVLVADSAPGFVNLYSSSGALEKKVTGSGAPNGTFSGGNEEEGNVTGVGVDEASGEIYVAESQRRVVSQFNSQGAWIGWMTGPPSRAFGEPRGVAVSPSGDVYVGDAGAGVVDVFGSDLVVPDAKTNAASAERKTSAILNGVVNGDGKPAKYSFQWGETEALGLETATQSAGVGEEKVAAELSQLRAGGTYFFRVKTINENGANYGATRQFVTKPAVEGLSTGPVQNLQPSQVTLTGAIDPAGVESRYFFEWGKTSAYGNVSPQPPADAGSGTESVEAKATLSGLSANTAYHYRLVGEDSFGTTFGEDREFTTSGPPLFSIEPATVEGHEAATLHARVDPGELETTYRFEYGTTTAYGTDVPAAGGKISAGLTPIPESAALSGLAIGTTYHYRIVASNSAGTTFGPDQTFTTVPPALIEAVHAAYISSGEATLEIQINPLGNETSYFFEYGTESCNTNPTMCTTVPSTPADAGSSEAGVAGSVRLEGLKPNTTYHYRASASNTLGTTESAEHTFTTEQTAKPFALPDGRAWEMVSPPDKHGAPVEALTREGGLILAAENGESLTYVADGSVVEETQGNRSPEQQQNLSTRTPNGWTTQDIATPNNKAQGISAGQAPEYQYFTPDLSTALVEPWGTTPLSEPALAPEAKQKTMYLRDNAKGSYLPLVTEANVAPSTQFGLKIHFLAATSDLSHVVLRSEVPLSEAPSGAGLYEWAAGRLQFLSLLPNGTPASAAELGFFGHVLAHAISSDGSRIVWTNKEDLSTRGGHLYMRDTAKGETLQLDAAQGVAEPGEGSAQFQSASADGSKVFFTDKQQLTADSTAEPASGIGRPDLYECEVGEVGGKLACHLKDLTVDRNEGDHAAVQGLLLGSSENGSSVYVVAQGVLANNQNDNKENAQAGGYNLYALHETAGVWTTTFIAQLSGEDKPEWEGNGLADTAFLTARVSPDGRYLAFMSNAAPTGYDNVDLNSGKRDEEVYLYDAASASLTCVSCNPTGGRPVGVFDAVESGEGLGLLVDRRKVWAEHWLGGSIPGWTAQSLVSALLQSRYLSDSGRLFFNSADALVPQVSTRTREETVNGGTLKVGVENVYEYEPSGVGGCESPSGGCVSLISAGSSGKESAFLEATPSGDDVFFLTASQLLPQDTDTAFDVYGARVCSSSSPCLTPPAPAPAACAATSFCRPASPFQPAPVTPPLSASYSGPGNPSTIAPFSGNLGTSTKRKPKALTRAQKLARALKACQIKHRGRMHRRQRRACERRAYNAYGAKRKARRSEAKMPGRRGR